MEITQTLYVTDRDQWRAWLSENHASAKEIWLIYYKKASGKPRIPYNDAVEEALCFGWIDSTIKAVDHERTAQRYSPRRKKSQLSELNKERVRQLIGNGKMTAVGLESIRHHLEETSSGEEKSLSVKEFVFPKDILDILKADKTVWENFNRFPEHYKRIRIGWIDMARERSEIFNQRLNYFIRMTAKNKMFGMMQ